MIRNNKNMVAINDDAKRKLEKLAKQAVKEGNPIRTQCGIVESMVQAAYEQRFKK